MIVITSINGHIKHPVGAKLLGVRADGHWLVLSYSSQIEVFYNQEGREVFCVEGEGHQCKFKSFVESVITRLAGRGKTLTRSILSQKQN